MKVTNGRIEFFWTRKLLRFKGIEPIKIDEIKSIVVDQGPVLQKIITADRVVSLGIRGTNEGLNFLDFLQKNGDLTTKDSWDIWKERGLLKIAYWINLAILGTISLLAISFIITRGFTSHLLLFILGGVINLFLYHRVIKGKLKD